MFEMAALCERERKRERKGRELVIGTGCKTLEDNGNNQEVSSTAGTLLCSLIELRTFLTICPKCKLLEGGLFLFKLRRKLQN
jgi:hypothetical protein